MATTPCSQAIRTIASDYVQKTTNWIDLSRTALRVTEACHALYDSEKVTPASADNPLLARLKPLIVECVSIQEQTRAAKAFIRVLPTPAFLMPAGDKASPAAIEYTRLKSQADRALNLLAERAVRIAEQRLIPAWVNTKNILEQSLKEAGAAAGVVGAFQARLPVLAGGTWAYVNQALDNYRAEQNAKEPKAVASTEPAVPANPAVPEAAAAAPTYEEEVVALTQLVAELTRMVATPAAGSPPPRPIAPPASPPAKPAASPSGVKDKEVTALGPKTTEKKK